MNAKQPPPSWPRRPPEQGWKAGDIALAALQVVLAGIGVASIGATCFAVLRAIAT